MSGAVVWLVLGVVGFLLIPRGLQASSLRWWVLGAGALLAVIAAQAPVSG
jgi:hypothetical protein